MCWCSLKSLHKRHKYIAKNIFFYCLRLEETDCNYSVVQRLIFTCINEDIRHVYEQVTDL